MRKHWSTSSDYGLYLDLKRLSEVTRIPTSRLVDEAIKDLLKKHNYEKIKDLPRDN